MLTDAERDQLRADVAATLPDQCRIVRRTRGAFDADIGRHGDPDEEEIYSGAGRCIPWPGVTRRVVVGEDVEVLNSYWLTLPWSADGIETGDVVIITESADTELVDRELVVRNVSATSIAADRRLVVEDMPNEEAQGS